MSNVPSVERIVESIRPLLTDHPSAIQGAALADLLAIWLAGHITADPTETAKARERLLAMHMTLVRQLIRVNAARIHGDDGS